MSLNKYMFLLVLFYHLMFFPVFAGNSININSAKADQLESLSGIGPVTAKSIVKYRESFGKFSTVDELENVKGIGPKKMEKLRPHIIVDTAD